MADRRQLFGEGAVSGVPVWTRAGTRVPVSAHIHPARATKSQVRQPRTVKSASLGQSGITVEKRLGQQVGLGRAFGIMLIVVGVMLLITAFISHDIRGS